MPGRKPKSLHILKTDGETASLAKWRKDIASNWPQVSITDTTGPIAKAVLVGQSVKFSAKITLGNLSPQDVAVQMQLGLRSSGGEITSAKDIEMTLKGQEGGYYLYEAQVQPEASGRQDYAMRIIPFNKNIPNPFTPVFVRWEM